MVMQRKPMTNCPYILFNQSPDQLRRMGARGGKARARNWRARLQTQAQAQARPPMVAAIDPLSETAAEAIVVLDAQFPWLAPPRNAWRPSAFNPDPVTPGCRGSHKLGRGAGSPRDRKSTRLNSSHLGI